jgi:hypothetical protein
MRVSQQRDHIRFVDGTHNAIARRTAWRLGKGKRGKRQKRG